MAVARGSLAERPPTSHQASIWWLRRRLASGAAAPEVFGFGGRPCEAKQMQLELGEEAGEAEEWPPGWRCFVSFATKRKTGRPKVC